MSARTANAHIAEQLRRDLGSYLPVLMVQPRLKGPFPWRYPYLVWVQHSSTGGELAISEAFERVGRDWGQRLRVRHSGSESGLYWVGVSAWPALNADSSEGIDE